MRTLAVLTGLVLSLHLLGCSGLASFGAVRSGDPSALRQALLQDYRQGRLSDDAVAELAEKVASKELRAAEGQLAVQRVEQVRACVRPLEDALEDRTERDDAAAPWAAMALVMAGRADADDWSSKDSPERPLWRAVYTLSLTGSKDGPERRTRILDPDENVRLSAVRAAEQARDPADQVILIDAARRDPNMLVRVQALRALAAVGDADAVLRLRDLWPLAPDQVRQAIVTSWGWPRMMEQGGERELLWVTESQSGAAAILAGGILFRAGEKTRASGLAALVAAMQSGLPRDRALAMSMAPFKEPAVKALVQKASAEQEPQVKVAALRLLAREPSEREKALKTLLGLAPVTSPGSVWAKAALAELGDMRVAPFLLTDAKSAKPSVRQSAAQGFIALGDLARAAFFLADPDRDIRTRTACQILVASERR